MDTQEAVLAAATNGWTERVVARRYADSKEGQRWAEYERLCLTAHGYVPFGQGVANDGDRHVNVGRTAAKLVLTGGLGLIVSGRSRSGGKDWLTVSYRLEGPPFQAREVTTYANMNGRGVKASSVTLKLDGFANIHFNVSGSVTNNHPSVTYERVELEIAVYRMPELVRIELGRIEISDLAAGETAPFAWRGGEHTGVAVHEAKNTTCMVVPRRAMPTDGIWDEPRPGRFLWGQLFPKSEAQP